MALVVSPNGGAHYFKIAFAVCVCMFIVCVLVCMCVFLHMYVSVHSMAHMWRSEDNSVAPVLSFHVYVGSRDQTQAISLVWEAVHTWGHLWPMVVDLFPPNLLSIFLSFLFLIYLLID